MIIRDAHSVIARSRRGAGQDNWGRVDAKVDVNSLVNAETAKKLGGLVDDFLAKVEEAITGQKALFDKDGKAVAAAKPKPVAKGQQQLPVARPKTDSTPK